MSDLIALFELFDAFRSPLVSLSCSLLLTHSLHWLEFMLMTPQACWENHVRDYIPPSALYYSRNFRNRFSILFVFKVKLVIYFSSVLSEAFDDARSSEWAALKFASGQKFASARPRPLVASAYELNRLTISRKTHSSTANSHEIDGRDYLLGEPVWTAGVTVSW